MTITSWLIFHEVLAAGGLFDIPDIPQDYDWLEYRLSVDRMANNNQQTAVYMYFNNDLVITGLNYRFFRLGGHSTVVYGSWGSTPEAFRVSAAQVAEADNFAVIEGTILNYTATDRAKTSIAMDSMRQTSFEQATTITCLNWNGSSGFQAISRMTLQPSNYPTFDFPAGSWMYLYGMKVE